MAAGWWRQTSDNKLVAAADSEMTVPADHDFVLASTIEAAYTGIIYQLGNWDGTTYTPPTDIITPFDPTAAGGDVQEAAHKAEDVFDNALELIDDNENAWTDDQKTKGREGIYWQRVNMARVCLNATRPAAERIKWCEECASWPTDTNGNVGSTWTLLRLALRCQRKISLGLGLRPPLQGLM